MKRDWFDGVTLSNVSQMGSESLAEGVASLTHVLQAAFGTTENINCILGFAVVSSSN